MCSCHLPLVSHIWLLISISSDEWESHPDLTEIIALQGRKDEEEECVEDDDGESSSELEEDNDRDADDDEDAYGDDEDDTVKADKKGLTLNMFSVLGENECEWGTRSLSFSFHVHTFRFHYLSLISLWPSHFNLQCVNQGLYEGLNINFSFETHRTLIQPVV